MKHQASETIKLGVVLALSGGFMDAYSYLGRGGVFANAQTGNILLLGVNLAQGNFDKITRYLLPIFAFIIGVVLSLVVRSLVSKTKMHWRQAVILIEVILFMIVAFIPQSQNILANSMISLACGMQVEAFRKVWGHPVATTMCIGNVRTGTENMYYYITKKDKKCLERSLICFLVVFTFIIGAIIGDICLKYLDDYAIIVSAGILLLGVPIMIFNASDDLDDTKNNVNVKSM